MKQGGRIGVRFDRWVDEWKMALSGIMLATRDWKFLLTALISFVVFGTLMNLLASSTAALNLFWVTDWTGKLSIIWDSFLAIFGVGRNFWDWLLIFAITLLQSVLIGLVVLVWRKKRRDRRENLLAGVQNTDNLQSAGLVAGLAVLGAGCPTCGTTLLAPVISTLFSTSGLALASFVSGALTIAAILVTLFAIQRIGGDAYAMIVSERFQKLHHKKEQTHE